jgi:hypothetical protein
MNLGEPAGLAPFYLCGSEVPPSGGARLKTGLQSFGYEANNSNLNH